MKLDLTDKVAIVTGGARGIGKSISAELARAGATVYIINRSAESANAALAEFANEGLTIKGELLDVADTEAVDQCVKKITAEAGGIDILVNNAGITRDGLLMRMKEEDWNAVMDTNLKGAFNFIKSVSRPMMKKRWGRIINVSSVIGLIGNAGQLNYSAAKAGMIGMTKAAAKELAARNINVNTIAPGYIVTDMTAALPDDVKDDIQTKIPLARLGQPNDIANLVVFLSSEAADYITGQTINVDGGMVM